MKIICNDKDVKSILESGFYLIPRFQRPYSWDRENIEDFWTDTIVESDSDYFIGPIVVYKNRDGSYGITDGQQRLTTITMVLCCIRNFLDENGFKDLAKGIHNFIEKPDVNNEKKYILKTETSYPYLQEYIQKFGKASVDMNQGSEEGFLKIAFEYIFNNIKESIESINSDSSISEANKKDQIKSKLIKFRDKMLFLKLIFIELEDEDDAYIIFETLNTRGKDLRISDLVKNLLTKYLRKANKDVDITKDKWNKMIEILDASQEDLSMDNFLLHFWLSTYEFTSLKKLYKLIKKRINKGNAKDFLDTLQEEVKRYREINEPTFRKFTKEELEIDFSLNALNLFKIKQHLPMILSIIREYDGSRLKLKYVKEILRSIEHFHFVFTAITSQRSSGGISQMYASYARQIRQANSQITKVESLRELAKKLRDKIPTYPEFQANFENIMYCRKYQKQKKLVQYILRKIYDKKYRMPGIPVDYSRMTIEHLAPENPSKNDNLTIEDVSKIGNLLYVDFDLNDKLKNKPFSEKLAILIQYQYPIDDIISNSTKWGKDEIDKRTKHLSEISYKSIWKI